MPSIPDYALNTTTRRSVAHSYFDEIFLVNLEHERSKKVTAIHRLKKVGIHPLIWKAVNGYDDAYTEEFNACMSKPLGNLFFFEFNDLERKRKKRFIESRGAWGYIRTYQAIIGYALRNSLKRILILEDDILPCYSFDMQLDQLMSRLNPEWKILQLGASQYNWSTIDVQKALEQGFYRPFILHTCGSFAIGLDHSVMQELLFNLNFMEAPFDHIPLGKLYEKYADKCFVAFPNLFMPDVTNSSIREPRDQIVHSQKMKWDLEQFPTSLPIISFLFHHPDQIRGASIGKQRLSSGFQANWIYISESRAVPIHSRKSPSLRLKHSNLNEDLPREFLVANPSDYIIELTRPTSYSDLEIRDFVEGLTIKNNGHPDFRVIHQKGYTAGNEFPPSNPKVSVIIPTCKRPTNLAFAIESVLDQTYNNFEIIVVDDNDPGSSYRQETEQLIDGFAGRGSIKYIKHEIGLNGAAARNTGLMASSGYYISFLDDDDAFLPAKLELCVLELSTLPPEFGGVYGGFYGWNSWKNDLNRYKSGDLTSEILKLQYEEHYLHTCTALYKKQAIMQINGFDDSFVRHQDLELNLRYFQHFKIGTVKELVASLRPTPTPVNNQLKGMDFFTIKTKYLNKFRTVIETFPLKDQFEIYEINLKEIKKHFRGPEQGLEMLMSKDKLGPIYYATINLRKEIENLECRNSDLTTQYALLREYRDSLLKQKDWYEETYESLPRFWKFVGTLLRKIGLAKKPTFTTKN